MLCRGMLCRGMLCVWIEQSIKVRGNILLTEQHDLAFVVQGFKVVPQCIDSIVAEVGLIACQTFDADEYR